MHKFKIVIIFLTIRSLSSTAQDLRFNHLTNTDGLSQSVVNCMLEDKLGFIWMGTQDGLNKYDGYSITILKNNPHDSLSLSGNNILSIFEDNEGLIWIGTNESGLSIYNRFSNTFKVLKHNDNNKNSLIDNTIRSITQDAQGIIWIGTENGICSYNKKNNQFTLFNPFENGLKSTRIWQVVNSKKNDNLLWVATFGEGVHVLNKLTKQFTQIKDTTAKGDLKVPNSNKIRTVFEDNNGNLWIGSNSTGLIKYIYRTKKFEYFVEGNGEKTFQMNELEQSNNYQMVTCGLELSMG